MVRWTGTAICQALRRGVLGALLMGCLLGCGDPDAGPSELWSIAASEIATMRSDWSAWESVSVDSITVAGRALSAALGVAVVERPNDRPVPCPIRVEADSIPDVSLYTELERPSPDSVRITVVFSCEFNDGRGIMTSHRSFQVRLYRRGLRWRVLEKSMT